MTKKSLYPLLCFLACMIMCVESYAYNIPVDEVSKNNIKIIENKGQWDPQVLFRAELPTGALFITRNSFFYSFIDKKTLHNITHNHDYSGGNVVNGHVYKVDFEGANDNPVVAKYEASSEYYNYFIGNDESKWASDCHAYGKIVLQNIYNGIDLELIALDQRIKINFVVKPYANPNEIRMKYEGASSVKVINEYVMVETTVAAVKEDVPVSSQPDLNVNGAIETHYQLDQNTLSFRIAPYNHAYPLIIDPELIFSTYSGSAADNWGFTATNDTSGYGYSGGTVYSGAFKTTTGAFQVKFNGGDRGAVSEDLPRDCAILKYLPDGSRLVYATYLGGSSNEQPHSMVCDYQGTLYVMGATWSSDFPIPASVGSYDRTANGNADIFVTRIASDGKSLKGSTYIGGSANDGINGMMVDRYDPTLNPLAYNYGDFFRGEINVDYATTGIYVATSTNSTDFPVVNGFQNALKGRQDGCVIKLNAELTAVKFSTYIGGGGYDAAYGIVADSRQMVYICGGTTSSDIGPASGPFSHQGSEDGFVAQISSNGSSLNKFLHIGTTSYDQAYLIQQDDNTNNIYITGQTEGYIPSKGNVYTIDNAKQYIMSFNHDLDSTILTSTFGVAGSFLPELSPSSFLVDYCGRVYFSGWGGVVNNMVFHADLGYTFGLPTTDNAKQNSTDGSDFYLVVFSPNLTGMDYATYFGDANSDDHVDGGTSRFDKHAFVYQSVCAGCGGSSSFPTTPGAWSRENKGVTAWGQPNCNNALFKMDMNVSTRPPVMKDTVLTVMATDTLRYAFLVSHPDGDSVFTILSGNVMNQWPNTPTINKIVRRTYNQITITWPTLCSNRDTFELIVDASDHNCVPHSSRGKIKIVVLPVPTVDEPYPSCVASIDDSTVKFDWLPVAKSKYFQTYKVYRKASNHVNASLIASMPYSDSAFTDTTAYNHLFQNYCYYITSVNKCGVESSPSRITCTMYEEDTATTSAFYFTKDTTLYVYPTDTLHYSTSFYTANSGDSITLSATESMIQEGHYFQMQNMVRGKGEANFDFIWVPGCNDITSTDTASITLFILNNQCPTPRKQFAYIKIVVLTPPTGTAPVLKCIHRTKGNPVVNIHWDQTPVNKYFSHFVLIRKDPNGAMKQIAEVTNGDVYSITDNAPNNDVMDYCYAAYPVTICNTIGDTSEFQCTVSRKDEGVPGVYIYTVTVEENKRIFIAWQSSNLKNFESFGIYKRMKNGPESGYTLLSNPTSDTTYTDNDVKVMSNVYCYQIRQTNNCGVESKEDGAEACSILLKGKSKPFEHRLGWTSYDYWTAGTDRYDLERLEPDQSPVITGWVSSSDTAWNDEHLNKENGLYYYTVVAQEGIGGYGYTSRSNTIELIQAPLLHVPNAFTPNGDGLNDRWEPDPVFVKDYNLKIYNRWGQVIFETNNKHETFNATFLNDPSSTDAYVYLITYTGWDSSTHVLKGNVTILR